jgi:hypothetical protein
MIYFPNIFVDYKCFGLIPVVPDVGGSSEFVPKQYHGNLSEDEILRLRNMFKDSLTFD